MTKFKLCGTAIAALMMSTLPAFAIWEGDDSSPCPTDSMCITSGGAETDDTSKGATVTRSGKGPATVQLPNRARAENPTSRAQERRSSKGGGAGGGDDIEGCPSCQD